MPLPPWMWIVAGPNGAGKSSFVGRYLDKIRTDRPTLFGGALVKLNADERTLELRRQQPNANEHDLNLQAAQEIDATVDRMIEAGHGFAVETVLSSDKYRKRVETAQANGFRLGLIYVSLHPPELSPARVNLRVQKGGHAVDPKTAVDRYHRSHKQLAWFARRADFLLIFDNSDTKPVLLASRTLGRPLRHLLPGRVPAVDAAIGGLVGRKTRPAPQP